MMAERICVLTADKGKWSLGIYEFGEKGLKLDVWNQVQIAKCLKMLTRHWLIDEEGEASPPKKNILKMMK